MIPCDYLGCKNTVEFRNQEGNEICGSCRVKEIELAKASNEPEPKFKRTAPE
ncbi:MAG: hypothetical protein HAW67_03445 [Endozoicomonadaceae bacterium]|nr:hypothetical protein [Endozoicomonadaceae bacterium]